MYVIYSKEECIYCKRAKDLLDSLGEPYQELNIEVDHNIKMELKDRLIDAGVEPPYTVPQIWTENEYIGGFTELNARVA